jgi:hypothetical protein
MLKQVLLDLKDDVPLNWNMTNRGSRLKEGLSIYTTFNPS